MVPWKLPPTLFPFLVGDVPSFFPEKLQQPLLRDPGSGSFLPLILVSRLLMMPTPSLFPLALGVAASSWIISVTSVALLALSALQPLSNQLLIVNLQFLTSQLKSQYDMQRTSMRDLKSLYFLYLQG